MTNFRSEQSIVEIENLAKKKALLIRNGSIDNVEDYILVLKRWWSIHYKRPLKDPLLDEYSLYDLLYEFYLVSEQYNDQEKVAGEIVKENIDEASSIFDDFFEEDTKPQKANLTEEEEAFMKQAFPEQDAWSMTENDF